MEYRDGVATLCEGMILFWKTDGTTEARSPSGAFFGETACVTWCLPETAGDFDGLLDRWHLAPG